MGFIKKGNYPFTAHSTMGEGSLVSSATSDSSSRRPPGGPAKFKGVVAQPNGHWGAQIYAQHQRVWLGTFRSEHEAAAAYDSAAVKLRSGPVHRNIPWTPTTAREPEFQARFSPDAVLAMIKDGSYVARFSDYLRAQHERAPLPPGGHERCPGTRLRQLFQKELTPSDVGKLNRLVIPKKYAVKYFPRIPDERGNGDGSNVEDMELVFMDGSKGKTWKLRYCYWKSSQSFVFTRGWNRFAKEKKLRARDRVVFSLYDQKLRVIDVVYLEEGLGLGPGPGPVEEDGGGGGPNANGDGTKKKEITSGMVDAAVRSEGGKGFRLFGFDIV